MRGTLFDCNAKSEEHSFKNMAFLYIYIHIVNKSHHWIKTTNKSIGLYSYFPFLTVALCPKPHGSY